jgi:hypothetical protein
VNTNQLHAKLHHKIGNKGMTPLPFCLWRHWMRIDLDYADSGGIDDLCEDDA